MDSDTCDSEPWHGECVGGIVLAVVALGLVVASSDGFAYMFYLAIGASQLWKFC